MSIIIRDHRHTGQTTVRDHRQHGGQVRDHRHGGHPVHEHRHHGLLEMLEGHHHHHCHEEMDSFIPSNCDPGFQAPGPSGWNCDPGFGVASQGWGGSCDPGFSVPSRPNYGFPTFPRVQFPTLPPSMPLFPTNPYGSAPVVRDHRHEGSTPVVRDHRQESGPIVRDHR